MMYKAPSGPSTTSMYGPVQRECGQPITDMNMSPRHVESMCANHPNSEARAGWLSQAHLIGHARSDMSAPQLREGC